MTLIYLDQNLVVDVCECMRKSKPGRDLHQFLRQEIERCASEGIAVFPYSEVHLAEAANVRDAESRGEQIRFWNTISCGYRFHDATAMLQQQIEAVLKGRPVHFHRQFDVHRNLLDFESELESPDREAQERRVESFRMLAKSWSSRSQKHISGRIRHEEIGGIIKLIFDDLVRLMSGNDLMRFGKTDHTTLLSEVAWNLDLSGEPARFEDAVEWIKSHALEIPAIFIDVVGIEHIAERFASDCKNRKNPEKAKVDHDMNDLRAAAYFFPYCDAVFTDNDMASYLIPKVRKSKHINAKVFSEGGKRAVFSDRRKFAEFLRHLKKPEPSASIAGELASRFEKLLIYIPMESDPLITGELLDAVDGLVAQVLPGGGLRVHTERSKTGWKRVIRGFQNAHNELMRDGDGRRSMLGQYCGGWLVAGRIEAGQVRHNAQLIPFCLSLFDFSSLSSALP